MSQAQTQVRRRPELARQLESLRQAIADMGVHVATAVERSVWAFTERNPDLATLVIEEDGKLNGLQHRAHELSYASILTQAPVATDLREILRQPR